jgi:GT2 family glycosyltransferase
VPTTDVSRVRVVVVNHKGGEATLRCLRALVQTDWPPDQLDVVVVDNASNDSVVDRIHEERLGIEVVVSERNLGFGGGNNLALRDRAGVDYVALVNPDTQVTKGWLSPLVDTLGQDPKLGAVCPKILLSGRYDRLAITSPTHIQRSLGHSRALGVRIRGVRVGGIDVMPRTRWISGTWGPERSGRWTNGSALIYLPVPDSCTPPNASIQLDAPVLRTVTLESGDQRYEYSVGPKGRWCTFPPAHPGAVLVNSVGTNLLGDGYGADRGWLEPDLGQYDDPVDVFAWSGAAVLIRGEYLDEVGLFDERLFLYYEDFELSWRGHARGWRYRTVPSSVIYHDHAVSTVEGSSVFDFFNERNRLLVLTRHGSPSLAWRAWARYVLATASYGRRDLVARLQGQPADWLAFRRRVRSLFAAARLVPAMLAARRGDRRDASC